MNKNTRYLVIVALLIASLLGLYQNMDSLVVSKPVTLTAKRMGLDDQVIKFPSLLHALNHIKNLYGLESVVYKEIIIEIADGIYQTKTHGLTVNNHLKVPLTIVGNVQDPSKVVFEFDRVGYTSSSNIDFLRFYPSVTDAPIAELAISGITVRKFGSAIGLGTKGYHLTNVAIERNIFELNGNQNFPERSSYGIVRIIGGHHLKIAGNIFRNNRNVEVINDKNQLEKPAYLHDIYLAHNSTENEIFRNEFQNCTGSHIRIRDNSHGNTITGNTFINKLFHQADGVSTWHNAIVGEGPSFQNFVDNNIFSLLSQSVMENIAAQEKQLIVGPNNVVRFKDEYFLNQLNPNSVILSKDTSSTQGLLSVKLTRDNPDLLNTQTYAAAPICLFRYSCDGRVVKDALYRSKAITAYGCQKNAVSAFTQNCSAEKPGLIQANYYSEDRSQLFFEGRGCLVKAKVCPRMGFHHFNEVMIDVSEDPEVHTVKEKCMGRRFAWLSSCSRDGLNLSPEERGIEMIFK